MTTITTPDEYTLAYRMAQYHLERLCREEAEVQWRHARTLPKRQQKTFQLHYSATVEALIEMSQDPTLTRQRVVAFLHAPETYVYEDAERRLKVQGGR
jgi:hypothetical protein